MRIKKAWPYSRLPFWCMGVIASFMSPVALDARILYAAMALGCVAWLASLRLPERRVLVALALVAAGWGYGQWRTQLLLDKQASAQEEPVAQKLEFEVASPVEHTAHAAQFMARTTDGQNLLLADYGQAAWPVGSRWRALVKTRAVIGQVNPVGFNAEAWALAQHLHASGSLNARDRTALGENQSILLAVQAQRQRIMWRIERVGRDYPQGAALVAALGVGMQNGLSPGVWEALRRLGVTHLISISGLHVSMVAIAAAWLLMLLWARLRLPEKPRVQQVLAGVVAAGLYALLSGYGVPQARSLLMIAITGAAFLARRWMPWWRIWWLSLGAVLLMDPVAVLSVGAWLSFGMVAALLWASGGRVGVLSKWPLLWRAQWAAGLASVAPTAYVFGQIPLVSPLANALLIPWFSWVLTPLTLLALAQPFDLPLRWACALGQLTLDVLAAVAQHMPMWPVAHAPIGLFIMALAATALLLLPRAGPLKAWAATAWLAFLLYRPAPPAWGHAEIVVWDVGQGLAVSVKTHEHALLFDAGRPGASKELAPNLLAQGVHELDAVVLSHNDSDHIGGFAEVSNAVKVKKIWAGEPTALAQQGIIAQHCQAPERWQWDGVAFAFLNQPVADNTRGNNAYSCVLKITAQAQSLLLMGDLPASGEEDLLRAGPVDATWLVLGHHGSKTSTSEAFLAAVRPQGAIASAGFANSYRHPNEEVMQRLQAASATLYRTDWQGALTSTLGRDSAWRPLVVKTPYWQHKPFEEVQEIPEQTPQ